MLAQLLGILLKLDLASDEFLVLGSPVDFACFLVLKQYEIILSCHSYKILPLFGKNCKTLASLAFSLYP
jgi:hypothetical protein